MGKKKTFQWLSILLIVSMLTGCGKTTVNEDSKEQSSESYKEETEETKETKDSAKTGEAIPEEETSLQYMEKVMIEDYYGNKEQYEMYAPIDSENHEGFVGYYGHGLMFSAGVHTYDDALSEEFKYEMWEEAIGWREEEWKKDAQYSDVEIGEVMVNGDDRYLIASANKEDLYGTPYEMKWIFYLDARGDRETVEWELEVSEISMDEETEQIVDEIAKCYGISLDGITTGGEWVEQDAQRQVARQDVYEPEEGDLVLDKVDGYQYLGVTTLPFHDGSIPCPVMVPMGWKTEAKGERASADMHGVSLRIQGCESYSMNYFALLEEYVDDECRYASESKTDTKNVEKEEASAMKGLDQAAYCSLSYEESDEESGDYDRIAKVRGLILLEDNYFLCCDLTLRSNDYDTQTDSLLKELENAYGMDLSKYYMEKGSEKEKVTELATMADLLSGDGILGSESEALPETVLWFNATYAALTYSNGWDWHLVGGINPTEENIALNEMLLQSSWGIEDRESALETVDSLIKKGHRGKCKEYMDQLEEWGLLSLKKKDFVQKLMEHDIESEVDLGRYMVAYSMHLSGLEPEDMAAWDLCRVNQLYADFYICGYMSYEEAMDASLENSLILQEMYGSWEEMMDAYMMGYQFWKGDMAVLEDSPTAERYHYYEILHDMEDGPYTLDWNMELKKSW